MPSPATLPAALVLLACLALPAFAADPPGPPPFGAAANAALTAYDDALAEADAAYDRAVAASAEPAARDAEHERLEKAAREKLATELAAAAKAATDAGDAGEAAITMAAAARYAALPPPLEARAARVEARRALLGTWHVRVLSYNAAWTFLAGGTLNSDRSLPRGRWRLEPGRVVVTWGEGRREWDSLHLPLDPRGSSGATHHGPDAPLAARKLAGPAREPLALVPPPDAPAPAGGVDPAVLVVPERPPVFRRPADGAQFQARADARLAELGGVEALAKSDEVANGDRLLFVHEGGQGEALGLKAGDVITMVDGHHVAGPGGVRRLRTDEPQTLTFVRDGVADRVEVEPGPIGFNAEDVFRPELVYLRRGRRDARWDALAVVGCAACRSDPDLAEAAWARAVTAGYRPDFVSDYCGMLIAWQQGRVADAVAYAASLETRGGDFPELNKEDAVVRLAVADFKLEQALAKRMTVNPGPRRMSGTLGDALERMLTQHRSLPPQRRTGPPPSELAEAGRQSLLDRMEAAKDAKGQRDAWREGITKALAADPAAPLAVRTPSNRYYTHVQVPTVDAADVELVVHVTFHETDTDGYAWQKLVKVGLVNGDQPEFGALAVPLSPNLLDVEVPLPGDFHVMAGSEERLDLQEGSYDVDKAARDGITVRIVHAGEREEVWIDERRVVYAPSLERPRRVGFMFTVIGVDARLAIKFNKLGKR